MEYVPPVGGDPDDPYIDGNPGLGIEGSPTPAAAIEHPMREIVNVIEAAGLTPDSENLTQLLEALGKLMPQFADQTGLMTSNGWISVPLKIGGSTVKVIIQWGLSGQIVLNGGVITNFPIAFPNTCFRVVGSPSGTTYSTSSNNFAVEILSATQFQLWCWGTAGSYGVHWIAIGY